MPGVHGSGDFAGSLLMLESREKAGCTYVRCWMGL